MYVLCFFICFLNISYIQAAFEEKLSMHYEHMSALDDFIEYKIFVLEEYTYALIQHETHVEASLEHYWHDIVQNIQEKTVDEFQWIAVFDGSKKIGFFILQILDQQKKRIAIHASPCIERYHILYVKEHFKQCHILHAVTCAHMPELVRKYRFLGFKQKKNNDFIHEQDCFLIYTKKMQGIIARLKAFTLQ